jgi:hypothetical protein
VRADADQETSQQDIPLLFVHYCSLEAQARRMREC